MSGPAYKTATLRMGQYYQGTDFHCEFRRGFCHYFNRGFGYIGRFTTVQSGKLARLEGRLS